MAQTASTPQELVHALLSSIPEQKYFLIFMSSIERGRPCKPKRPSPRAQPSHQAHASLARPLALTTPPSHATQGAGTARAASRSWRRTSRRGRGQSSTSAVETSMRPSSPSLLTNDFFVRWMRARRWREPALASRACERHRTASQRTTGRGRNPARARALTRSFPRFCADGTRRTTSGGRRPS